MKQTIKRIKKGVVGIKNDDGIGTGFFVKPGIVATNHHVAGDQNNKVQIKDVDNNVLDAVVCFSDKKLDLAFLKVILPEDQTPTLLNLAQDTSDLETSTVFAIGHPSGLSYTVTKGIISSVRNRDGIEFIQTDASINPGNSGGPLFLENGDVVGMNSFIFTNRYGIGFALSAGHIIEALDQSADFETKETKQTSDSGIRTVSTGKKICDVCNEASDSKEQYCGNCGCLLPENDQQGRENEEGSLAQMETVSSKTHSSSRKHCDVCNLNFDESEKYCNNCGSELINC